jgi:hypothetical protein
MIDVRRRVTEIDGTISVLRLRYRQHRLEDLRVTLQLATMDFESKGPSGEDDITVGEPEILARAEREVRSGVTPPLGSIRMIECRCSR